MITSDLQERLVKLAFDVSVESTSAVQEGRESFAQLAMITINIALTYRALVRIEGETDEEDRRFMNSVRSELIETLNRLRNELPRHQRFDELSLQCKSLVDELTTPEINMFPNQEIQS